MTEYKELAWVDKRVSRNACWDFKILATHTQSWGKNIYYQGHASYCTVKYNDNDIRKGMIANRAGIMFKTHFIITNQ